MAAVGGGGVARGDDFSPTGLRRGLGTRTRRHGEIAQRAPWASDGFLEPLTTGTSIARTTERGQAAPPAAQGHLAVAGDENFIREPEAVAAYRWCDGGSAPGAQTSIPGGCRA